MKITEETTLGQLAIMRAQHGIISITVMGVAGRCIAGLRSTVIDAGGSGTTEAEALDRAFEDFIAQVAARYSEPLS